jgi:single-stranded DNA-binding protein
LSYLKCSIAGVYVFDRAERRFTATGKELAQFKGSVSRKKGDGYENASADIVMWEPSEDSLVWSLEKGSRVKIEGKFWPGAYVSKKDGEAKATINITAEKLEIDDYSRGNSTGDDGPVPF